MLPIPNRFVYVGCTVGNKAAQKVLERACVFSLLCWCWPMWPFPMRLCGSGGDLKHFSDSEIKKLPLIIFLFLFSFPPSTYFSLSPPLFLCRYLKGDKAHLSLGEHQKACCWKHWFDSGRFRKEDIYHHDTNWPYRIYRKSGTLLFKSLGFVRIFFLMF